VVNTQGLEDEGLIVRQMRTLPRLSCSAGGAMMPSATCSVLTTSVPLTRNEKTAAKGVTTQINNMVHDMATVEITIERAEIERRYPPHRFPEPRPNCLADREEQWAKMNRGETGQWAYDELRRRVAKLVDETYPQFAEGMPEVTGFAE
jgi:hypothetical protein